jgi:TPR repeat protein
MPSLGFCLVAAQGLLGWEGWWGRRGRTAAFCVLVCVLLAYAGKTVARNRAWKDDFTLSGTDVRTSWNSAHSNAVYGGKWFDKGDVESDPVVKRECYEKAVPYLLKAFEVYPGNYNVCLKLGRYYGQYRADPDRAMYFLERAVRINDRATDGYNNLGIAYGMKGDQAKAVEMFSMAHRVDPANAEALYNLGAAYKRGGDWKNAASAYEQLVELRPGDKASVYELIGLYRELGDEVRERANRERYSGMK